MSLEQRRGQAGHSRRGGLLIPGHETAAAGKQSGRGGRLPGVWWRHRGLLCPAQCDRLVTCGQQPVNLSCEWIIVLLQCDSA